MFLIPWKSEQNALGIRDEMDCFLNDFFGSRSLLETQGFMPAVDVRETENALVVEAEIPGIQAKDLDVQVNDGVLSIRGERKAERESKEKGNPYWAERSYGCFERQVALPSWVDPEKVDATYKDGIVRITLAKKPEAKPKSVDVKVK